MENKLIIGIVGFIGSGKGTVGDHLRIKHGFVSASFAGNLKDAIAPIFGWRRDLLEGNTIYSREWREQPDVFWSEKLGQPVTPRWVLQHIGTDVMRKHFHENIWLWSLEKKLSTVAAPVVLTDVRFPNEIDMVRRLGGKLWWIRRPRYEPEWVETAISCKETMRCNHPEIHPTEYEWLGTDEYTVIYNDNTLSDIGHKVDQLIATIVT
jgi:hypothetical protein